MLPKALIASLLTSLAITACTTTRPRSEAETPTPVRSITEDKLIRLPRPADQPILPPPEIGGTQSLLVVLFVDGLSWADFQAALERGDLPSVDGLRLAKPTWMGKARASFPTSTAPNVPEMVAGRWSDHLGGMPDNIHALDRSIGRLVRYEVEGERWNGTAMTLFDHLKARGGQTLSYFEGNFAGADLTIHKEVAYLMDLIRLKGQDEAVLAYDDRMVEDFGRRLGSAGRLPNVVFLRLGGVDAAGHFYGTEAKPFGTSIRALDGHINQIITLLSDTRVEGGGSAFDLAHVMVVSDHGMEDTPHYVDLDALLRDSGLNPFPTSTPRDIVVSEVLPDTLKERDVIAVPDGSNVAAIYLRARGPGGKLGWAKLPEGGMARAVPLGRDKDPVDLVARLVEEEGVLRVLERLPRGAVRIHGAEGSITVRVRYTPEGALRLGAFVEGEDPYGACGEGAPPCCPVGQEARDRCYLGEAAWRAATTTWEHPEMPRMVVKAFGSSPELRPDLLVEASDGFGFMRESMGNHGRYSRALMEVPLLLSGTRVNPEATPQDPRLVDLTPTLLPLFGITQTPPEPRDGEDIGLILP